MNPIFAEVVAVFGISGVGMVVGVLGNVVGSVVSFVEAWVEHAARSDTVNNKGTVTREPMDGSLGVWVVEVLIQLSLERHNQKLCF